MTHDTSTDFESIDVLRLESRQWCLTSEESEQ